MAKPLLVMVALDPLLFGLFHFTDSRQTSMSPRKAPWRLSGVSPNTQVSSGADPGLYVADGWPFRPRIGEGEPM